MSAAAWLCLAAAIPVALACGYLLLVTLCSAALAPPPAAGEKLRFDILVPAHNEERGIAQTVTDLRGLAWPREQFRVVVIADNCSDQTASRAREAGAEIWERFDAEKRGKGYALEMAFARSLEEGEADAVVVIDADTVAAPALLQAFASRLAAGARAIQADYAVRNPNDSWRTRLMAIAFSMFHALRSNGRERLGLSCGLRGNGMCFSRALLEEIPHRAFSLVEDVEYGIHLGEAGVRVWYAGEAQVFGEMVASEKGSRSQRRRWEGGRAKLARLHGPRLLREAFAWRDPVLFDLALDVLVPPLSLIALAAGVGSIAALGVVHLGLAPPWIAGVWCASAVSIALYVLRGWALSGTGPRGLLDLALSPLYILWKIGLRLRPTGLAKAEWVRTTRGEDPR